MYQEVHRARLWAESFGSDPERYDRTRPRYPEALVERIVAVAPGRAVVDVGCGTGIVARQFRAAGCRVLGVEVDDRMAAFARRGGFEVVVARFEDWQPCGRGFDAVVSGQSWHWIDPVAGAAKAAEALGPGGRLAVFWNVHMPPPDVGEAFAAVYRRVVPQAPGFAPGLEAYAPLLRRAAEGMRAVESFGEPEQWRFDWERSYTRAEWLEQVPTFGGHSRLAPETLEALLTGIGDAIDDRFTMPYAAVVVTARRH